MIKYSLKKKFEVCHVTSAHTRYDVRIFHKECKSLAKNGYGVTLLVNDNLPEEVIEGVRIVSTKIKPKNRFERMVMTKKYLKNKMIEIDAEIYHFHDPELLNEAAWIKNKGKKVIFDFHEDVSQQILYKEWIPRIIRSLVSKTYKLYEKNKAKKFDALITVTPKFVERLKKINSNTIMITNYPIINNRNEIKSINKKRAICFAGGISSQWNHENIIKAIESIDDIEYILAGSGSLEYLEKLKKLDGWSKVRYLGRIPHEKVYEIYSESMLGISLLSNKTQVGDEGTLGNTKIFEFMETNLPFICSDNKVWTSIVDKYRCGIVVDPNDIPKIKKSIVYLIENNEKSMNMGLNGKSAALNEFNWTKMEISLLDLYGGILKD